MMTAARTASQITTHMLIAFALMFGITGSAAFGGLAAIVEPIINVALLPLHARLWRALRERFGRSLSMMAGEKISQTLMHMAVAFAVIYWATGSAALGGVMTLVEPVCNVIVLPLHDRAWERVRVWLASRTRHPWVLA